MSLAGILVPVSERVLHTRSAVPEKLERLFIEVHYGFCLSGNAT